MTAMLSARNASLTAHRRSAAQLLVLVGAVMLAPVVVACGSSTDKSAAGSTASATAPGSASPTASSDAGAQPGGGAAASASKRPATASSAAPVANVASCQASAVKVTIAMKSQAQYTGTLMATMTLINTSTRACRLSGWATVTLRNAADEPLSVPTQKVNQPAAPAAVDLAPGAAATAGLKWVHCEKDADDCPVGNTLAVSLPGDSSTIFASLTGFPAAERSDITMQSLQIGSIQVSGKNVLGW